MKFFLRMIIGVCALFVCTSSLYSQNTFPSLDPVDIPCAGNANASPRQLMEAAIVLSGFSLESSQAKNALAVYDSLVTKLSSQYKDADSATRAEAVLTLMYDQVLTRYELPQSSMIVLFEKGTYNCVSSSVLYACLASELGLTVQPKKTTGHAFCQVNINGSWVSVETTNPYGYNPGQRKYVSEDSSRYAVVEARVYRSCLSCSLPMLVSLIAQNRAADAKNQGDYALSVQLMLDRLSLLQNAPTAEYEEALDSFLSACNNYAVNEQRQKNYVRALDWLILCKNKESRYWSDTLQSVYDNTLFNQCAEYLNAGKWEEASNFLDAYKKYASQTNVQRLSVLVFIKYIEETAYSLNPDAALEFLEQVKSNPLTEDKTISEKITSLMEYAWLKKINGLAETQGYLVAAQTASQALEKLPQNALLNRSLKACLENYAVQVHNAFATLANAGKYTEARRLLDEGLANYPNSTVLQRDSKSLSSMGY